MNDSHLRQVRLKAIKGLIPSLGGPKLNRLIAFRGRLEEHPQGELGLAALLSEGHRHLRWLGFFVRAISHVRVEEAMTWVNQDVKSAAAFAANPVTAELSGP